MVSVTKAVLLVLLVIPTPVFATDFWLPISAHNTGFGGSTWRTDLALYNPCDVTATVDIVADSPDGEFSKSFEIPAGTQQNFEDILGQLTTVETTAALEIHGESELVVSSRTYNQSTSGTFGQGFDGIEEGSGIQQGSMVVLPQLKQNSAFRTNIGVLNMGESILVAKVSLFDRLGLDTGNFNIIVNPGTTVLDTQSFKNRFGREDIVGGFAKVEILIGSDGWAFASVVDNTTSDPTTVVPRSVPICSTDITTLLGEIEGLEFIEGTTQHSGYRFFELYFTPPLCH